MKLRISLSCLFVIMLSSCTEQANIQTDEEIWKLGWRMIASSLEEEYTIAELQFDSLVLLATKLEDNFLKKGLDIKSKLGKQAEIESIINAQDEKTLIDLCRLDILRDLKVCTKIPQETVSNPELQQEIIRMFVDDQVVRGNRMEDLISKYNIDTTMINDGTGLDVDEINRNRLKEIIAEYGFPTRKLVGKDAMEGIFFIIQHADGEKDWQKSQLPNIESAVIAGDMDGQSYAYLYDRIKINSGQEQVYGTQFSKYDPVKRIVELAPTENMEKLNERRMKVGMMPIEMYKAIMLKNL
ncbi:MAG: hypothetical protein KJO29_02750 [Bacteroidia bacterium]|nr:hypothetical protein [Bacteroidia bacterium]